MLSPESFSCETKRLRLRPLEEADAGLYHELYTDPEVMRFIGSPMTSVQAARALRDVLAGMRTIPCRCVYLVMLDKVTKRPLGICGVPRWRANAIQQEVGLVLTRQTRSQGFAREGLAALVDRVFAVSPVDEVWSGFSTKNLTAQRLVLAVGFVACDEKLSVEEASSMRRWSMCRSSWRSVERNQ